MVLSAKGEATLDRAPDALQQRFVREFERLEDWEQAQLLSSLERVAAMLDARDIDASPVLAVGGRAVYIPYHTTWAHETVTDQSEAQGEYFEVEHIGMVPELVQR